MRWLRHRPVGAILTVACAVLAVLITLFLILAGAASYKTSLVEKRWGETLGTPAEVLRRYPPAEANAAALELERLTIPLGIDLATHSYQDRPRPSKEQKRAFKDASRHTATYRKAQLELSRRRLEVPPQSVVAFLDDHAVELRAVRRHLTSGVTPRWEMHLERGFAAPIPNLLGHIDLQKLLVTDAFVRLQAGRRDLALENLEAAWTLFEALRDDPVLITQLVLFSDAQMIAGVLRQIEDPPAIWLERLAGHEPREIYTTALKFEGRSWTQIGDAARVDGPGEAFAKLFAGVARPYLEFCAADASDDYRTRLLAFAEVPAVCDYDLKARGAELEIPVPRWNYFAKLIVPNLGGTVDRLGRLELDLELTTKLLQIQQARIANGGTWPDEIAGISASEACPRDGWIYEVGADGTMDLSFTRNIEWPDVRGPRLTARFTLESDD